MEELYEAAGYAGRPSGFGRRPAVVAIDFQNAVTDPESPMGRSPLVHDAVEATARLLEEARRQDLLVVSCVTAYRADGKDRPRWKVTSVDDWVLGSWHAELDPRLTDPRDVLLVKKAPSIFFGTHLPGVLTRYGADTVIVTGANTSGCIRASVLDSFSYGYHTVVPRQCVGDQGLAPHEQNLLDVDRRYADVLDLESVLEELRRLGPIPEQV